jgi:putative nucleotidyltransferase with HDIG domain
MTPPLPDRDIDMREGAPTPTPPRIRHSRESRGKFQQQVSDSRFTESFLTTPEAFSSRRATDTRAARTTCYVLALITIALALVAISALSMSKTPSVLALLLLMITAVIAERQSVNIAPSIDISVAFFPILLAAVLFGAFWAALIGAVGLSLNFGRPYLRWMSWLASRLIVAVTAGEVAHITSINPHHSLASLTLSAALAVIAYTVLETSLASATLLVRGTTKVAQLIRTAVVINGVSIIMYSPIVAVLAYAYYETPRWTLGLLIAPAFAAQRLFVLYRQQRETATRLTEAITRLERVNLSFATALVTALDARDHYTAGHSAAVAVYARDIAIRAKLTEDEIRQAHLCGLLHDIGKIGVPTGVLEKEGPLAQEERLAIEAHVTVGASILSRVEGYEEIAVAVRHHHERYDGRGYPDRIGGETIPFLARIVAVADAYSAMTSERPYRVALNGEEARRRLEQDAGGQFDPKVVKVFFGVLGRAGEDYANAVDMDFEVEMSALAPLEPQSTFAVSN